MRFNIIKLRIMKTSQFILGTIAAGAMLSIAACTAPTSPDNSLAFNRLEVSEAYRLENSAEGYGADSDLVIACRADLLLPEALFGHDAKALQDTILLRTFGKANVAAENRTQTIRDYFKSYVEEEGYPVEIVSTADCDSDDFFNKFDGYTGINVEPMTITTKVLSFQMTASAYAPRAAHGMYSTSYVNYDLVNGKVVDLADLITASGIAKLPDMLKQRARNMQNTIGPTELTGLPAGDNFFINSDNEFVFAYQPYEIASYAQGEIRIPVPAYLIADYLTPQAKALLF